MGIENENSRTSSWMDCKHNVLHKHLLIMREKEIINTKSSIPFPLSFNRSSWESSLLKEKKKIEVEIHVSLISVMYLSFFWIL